MISHEKLLQARNVTKKHALNIVVCIQRDEAISRPKSCFHLRVNKASNLFFLIRIRSKSFLHLASLGFTKSVSWNSRFFAIANPIRHFDENYAEENVEIRHFFHHLTWIRASSIIALQNALDWNRKCHFLTFFVKFSSKVFPFWRSYPYKLDLFLLK